MVLQEFKRFAEDLRWLVSYGVPRTNQVKVLHQCRVCSSWSSRWLSWFTVKQSVSEEIRLPILRTIQGIWFVSFIWARADIWNSVRRPDKQPQKELSRSDTSFTVGRKSQWKCRGRKSKSNQTRTQSEIKTWIEEDPDADHSKSGNRSITRRAKPE